MQHHFMHGRLWQLASQRRLVFVLRWERAFPDEQHSLRHQRRRSAEQHGRSDRLCTAGNLSAARDAGGWHDGRRILRLLLMKSIVACCLACVTAVVSVALFAGCDSKFGGVSGRVTLDGEPLVGGTVEFSPEG